MHLRSGSRVDQDKLLHQTNFRAESFGSMAGLSLREPGNGRFNPGQSIFSEGEFNNMIRNPFGESSQAEDEGPGQPQNAIFGVNSDVSFLHMIGKMCQQSEHDLHSGL